MSAPLLAIEDLAIGLGRSGPLLVDGMHLTVPAGGMAALVGESGSGKSLTALAVPGLLPSGVRVRRGRITLDGTDLLELAPRALRAVRGSRVGLVFQDPLGALNPHLRVGEQVLEAVRVRSSVRTRREARARALELLGECGLDDSARYVTAWPHELSGGQRQRAVIAMALAGDPELLIADEPTTALDVTVQARILELFRMLARERGMALLLITHDLGVVAGLAQHVTVAREGRVVEEAATSRLLGAPAADYTRELLAAVPRIEGPGPQNLERAPGGPLLLDVRRLEVSHPGRGRERIVAVDGVDLAIGRGETLALVGESGCGKTTLARAVLGLQRVDAGNVLLRIAPDPAPPLDLAALPPRELRPLRRHLQVVFQDPAASLDPRRSVFDALAEPMRNFRLAHGADLEQRAVRLLEQVELPRAYARRYPHELSGGERQRVCIARALASRPRLIVLDEAVSSLDVSLQSRMADLLVRLQTALGVAYLFITHDLGVVRRVAHRVAVMRAGRIVETAAADDLFAHQETDYARELLAAVPRVR